MTALRAPTTLRGTMSGASDDPITEGFFDRHVHRPLAAWILGRAPRRPSVTELTAAALVVGLSGALGAMLASPHSLRWIFPAGLLLAFTVAARARREIAAEPPGPALELAVGAAFWTALAVRAAPEFAWGCTLAAFTLASALAHAGLHAQIRARFLGFTAEGGAPSEPAGLGAALSHDLAAFVLRPEYLGVLPPRGAARSLLAGPMRMAAILSPSTHLTLLSIAAVLAVVGLDLSFGTVVLAVAGALNVWALLVVSAWRRAEVLVRRLAPV